MFDKVNAALGKVAANNGGVIYTRGQPHADYNKRRRLWEIVIDGYSLRVSAIVNLGHTYLEINDLKLLKPSSCVLGAINDLMILSQELHSV